MGYFNKFLEAGRRAVRALIPDDLQRGLVCGRRVALHQNLLIGEPALVWPAPTPGYKLDIARQLQGPRAAEPVDPPISIRSPSERLAKPKELDLNVHGNSRPNTSISVDEDSQPWVHE
jgi:hypothetical protein